MSENPYAAPATSVEVRSSMPAHPGHGSPYGPFRRTRGLANTLMVLFGINVVLLCCSVAGSFFEMRVGGTMNYNDESPEYIAFEQMNLILLGASAIVGLLLVIIWCIWANMSCKNAWLINSRDGATAVYRGRESFTPGWTVGWFFVPITNLWKPFQAMAWIRDASQKSMGLRMGKLVGVWWTFWILYTVSDRVVTRLMLRADTMDSLLTAHRFLIVLSPIDLLAMIFAALVVHRLTQIQKIRAKELGLY